MDKGLKDKLKQLAQTPEGRALIGLVGGVAFRSSVQAHEDNQRKCPECGDRFHKDWGAYCPNCTGAD